MAITITRIDQTSGLSPILFKVATHTVKNGGGTFKLQVDKLGGKPVFTLSEVGADADLWSVGGAVPSLIRELDEKYPTDTIEGALTEAIIQSYKRFGFESSNFFGAWVNEGKVYVDLIDLIEDKDEAVELAKSRQELAIFNLYTFEELATA